MSDTIRELESILYRVYMDGEVRITRNDVSTILSLVTAIDQLDELVLLYLKKGDKENAR